MTRFLSPLLQVGIVVLAFGCCLWWWGSSSAPSYPTPPARTYPVNEYVDPRSLPEVFAALTGYLEAHHPHVAATLGPPTTEAEIAAFEAEVGRRLPEDLRQFYLLADGQRRDGPATDAFSAVLPDGYAFMPLEWAASDWRMMKALLDGDPEIGRTEPVPQGPVHDRWWHPAWIPIGSLGNGDLLCVDLDPAPGGDVGQIIEFIHDDLPRPHVARSVTDLLGEFEAGLRDGSFVYYEDWGAFVRAEDTP